MAIARTEKVLIVDDSSFMRRLIVEVVRSAGFTNILEAEDGAAAVQMYEAEKPDVVLMDLIMPKMTGLEVLKVLVPQGAKIIVISAIGQKGIIEDAFLAGAKGYFIKPFFEETTVLNMIESALRNEVIKPDYDATVLLEEHREIAQQGAAKSASALTVILHNDVAPLGNTVHTTESLEAIIENLDACAAGKVVGVTGLLEKIPGFVYMTIDTGKALKLVDILNGKELGTTTSLEGEMECSTIKEVLNILSNAYTSVFTPHTYSILATELPYVIDPTEFRHRAEGYFTGGTNAQKQEVVQFATVLGIPSHTIEIQLGFVVYHDDIA